MRSRVIGTMVAATILIGGYAVVQGGGGGAPPGTANIWIDSNGGTCTRNSSPAAYADAAACGSLDAAATIAQNGDTVLIKSGSYGSQTITHTNSRTAMASFQSASGETVTLTRLQTDADWLTFKDLTIPTTVGSNRGGGWFDKSGTAGSHITLDNVDITGPGPVVSLANASNLTWKNSEMGTAGNTDIRLCGDPPSGDGEQPVNLVGVATVTFDHVTFHPFFAQTGSPNCDPFPPGDMHLETIRMFDHVTDFHILNSFFDDNSGESSARIFDSPISGAGGQNFWIVNTYIGRAEPQAPSVYLTANDPCDGYVFAYSTYRGGFNDGCSPKTSLTIVGSYAIEFSCMGTTEVKNVWVDSSSHSCGTDTYIVDGSCHATVTPSCLANFGLAGDDYHLTSSSALRGAGDTSLCNTYTGGVDADGHTRTTPCDVGPQQYTP